MTRGAAMRSGRPSNRFRRRRASLLEPEQVRHAVKHHAHRRRQTLRAGGLRRRGEVGRELAHVDEVDPRGPKPLELLLDAGGAVAEGRLAVPENGIRHENVLADRYWVL